MCEKTCPKYEAFVVMARHMAQCINCQMDAGCEEYERLRIAKDMTPCTCGKTAPTPPIREVGRWVN